MLTNCIGAPYNCDAVEVNTTRKSVFVGMYQYEESTSERGGGYLLANENGTEVRTSEQVFGCLDAKWCDDRFILTSCSDGVLRWIDSELNSITHEIAVVPNPSSSNTENIIMTVDKVGDLTACITAKGQLSLVKGTESILSSWEAHSPVMESWCCGLNPKADVVVSGSDDCSLKYWDVRTSSLIHNDKKNHTMGTTCIEFLSDDYLLSGSYDDRIRKFDMRNLSLPIEEIKTIGGVWRLKPHDGLLFVAACYGGCQVLDLVSLKPVVTEYKGHESMAYGIDYLGEGKVVSCSFYDKSIQYWTFQVPS